MNAELTHAVLTQIARCPDPRLRRVSEIAVRHLHAAIREAEPTEEEWMAFIRFLTAVGRASGPERHEMIMLSDLLGASMLVEELADAHGAGATPGTVLEPFHLGGAPALPSGGDLCPGAAGDAAVVAGRVLDPAGVPVRDAAVDVWQSDGRGLDDVQMAPGSPPTRGRLVTDTDGAFWFRTVRPVSYPVPTDGPAGRLLPDQGRQPVRPAPIHFRISAPGHVPLTTHLFDADDPYLGADPVFGVRDGLVIPFAVADDPSLGRRFGTEPPFHLVRYDFVLASAATHVAEAA